MAESKQVQGNLLAWAQYRAQLVPVTDVVNLNLELAGDAVKRVTRFDGVDHLASGGPIFTSAGQHQLLTNAKSRCAEAIFPRNSVDAQSVPFGDGPKVITGLYRVCQRLSRGNSLERATLWGTIGGPW